MIISTVRELRRQLRMTPAVVTNDTLYSISSASPATPRQHITPPQEAPTLVWCGETIPLEKRATLDFYGSTINIKTKKEEANPAIPLQGMANMPRRAVNAGQNARQERQRYIGAAHGKHDPSQGHELPGRYFVALQGFYQLEESQHDTWQDRNYVQLGKSRLEIRDLAFTIDDAILAEQGISVQQESSTEGQNYTTARLDATATNHFAITPELERIAKQITSSLASAYDKGKALFDFIGSTVRYRKACGFYNMPPLTYAIKEGNCAETSALFIGMARAAGLDACFSLVHIDHTGKDFRGKPTGHACATLATKQGKVHADNAYYTYDARHRLCEEYQDFRALALLSRTQWV